MKRTILTLLSFLFIFSQTIIAQDKPKTEFKFSGVYNAWGQNQNNFLLGKTDYQDQYLVQMLRLNFSFNYTENMKAVTRFDLGQGWWGVDNQEPSYNGASGMFDGKDTKYFLHVDHAYLWFNVPSLKSAFTVGRFNWSLGNKLVLDNNYDGITADIKVGEGNSLKLGWTKASEGVNGLSDLEKVAPDPRGNYDARDANLFLASYNTKFSTTNLEFYGAYYNDASVNDSTAFLIDGIYYNRPRFTPQVTSLAVFGIAGTSKFDALTFNYEANYLIGKDDIKNTKFAGKLNTARGVVDPLKYDINNGDLKGYNIYAKLDYAVSPDAILGLVAGMGSGDDDPTKGEGNVNKLSTAGFFFLTEVWEDSIMPDEEGITPQGLGAPNIRAYRELENTTALQVNGLFKLTPAWKVFTSFTYLRATQPVFAWTAAGPNLSKSANDLGWEVDLKTDYNVFDNLVLTCRVGYFKPGTAAMYLINGTDQFDKSPWETKAEITFTF